MRDDAVFTGPGKLRYVRRPRQGAAGPACELAARIGYLGRSWRLSYWRTVDGAEVDFVLETPKEAIAVEVKYTKNPRPADAAGIEHFISRHPGKAKRGFVVCRCARTERLSAHVLAIPWEDL